ncbi:MAG: hypothetical protein L6R40_000556 [Gallowayella cf. fulva]|nr:MAG: hypothetical protein L6R40_000556 [Xanthomendoza cf. fulva]
MSSTSLEKHRSSDKAIGETFEEASTNSDTAAEKAVLRRVDRHILPFIALIYLFSFLDRSNIGNGRLYGLEEDLGLKANQFQTATSVFFATYVACEIPTTIFLKKLRPARFISSIAILWGIITTLTGLTQNYGSFLACRLLLGLAEGPLFPGLIVYLTMFYTRKELAVRFGYLVLGGALSGAVGGMLAYAIGYMDGLHGLRAWRWLLIIEGLPPICLGLFGWFFLADSPGSAWYLSPSQRKTLILRGTRDQREASTPSASTLHRSDVLAAVKDWKVWAFCLLNFPGDVQLFSYAIFLPTIVKAINPAWSTLYVQALTIPCFAWSAMVYFAAAYTSDRLQHRAVFGILGCLVSIVGQVMLIAGRGVAVRYAGCFMIASGIYVVSGIALVWMPTNLPRYGKRSTAVGMQLMFGNSAGIAAPYVSPAIPPHVTLEKLSLLSVKNWGKALSDERYTAIYDGSCGDDRRVGLQRGGQWGAVVGDGEYQ